MAPQRERTLPYPCPRCGGALKMTEVGIMVDQSPDPVSWEPVRRRCASGCLLTVEDFPDGQ